MFYYLNLSLGKKGPKLSHTGQIIERYIYTCETGCKSVCFVVAWAVSMDLASSNTHILSPSPHTNMIDSIELEPGISTTLMTKDLPHLTILASFLLST